MTDTLAARWDALAEHPELHVCSLPETTAPTVRRIVNAMPTGGHILDLGCGPGRVATRVADLRPGLTVDGLDISPRMIAQAPAHPRVHYQLGDGRIISGEQYDGAYSTLVFQHLPPATVAAYLTQLAYALQPGAPLVVQFIVGDYHLDLDHRYRPGQLATYAETAGFDVELVQVGAVAADWGWLHARRPT